MSISFAAFHGASTNNDVVQFLMVKVANQKYFRCFNIYQADHVTTLLFQQNNPLK